MSDAADFATQVEALRPQLLRFARSQLRNDAWAEDAVSDTLLAALEALVAAKGAAQASELARCAQAWDHAADRTPHGQPIELQPSDWEHA